MESGNLTQQHKLAWDSYVAMLATALAYAVVGTIVLPMLFGAAPSQWIAVVWLGLAVVLSVCAIVLLSWQAEPQAASLGRRLARLGAARGPSITPSQTLLLWRLVVAGIELLLAQAVLRRPLALVLGGERSASLFEAGVAAGSLALLLVGLVWVYQTARPMVYAAVLRIVDVAVPTAGSAPPAVAVTHEPSRSGGGGVVRRDADPTVRASRPDDATVASPRPDDATVASPHSSEETVASPRDDRSQDPTLVRRPDA